MPQHFCDIHDVKRLWVERMLAVAILLVTVIFLSVVVAFGGPILRRLLAKDHVLQKYLTDDALESALGWIARNKGQIAGGLLLATFTVITIVYS